VVVGGGEGGLPSSYGRTRPQGDGRSRSAAGAGPCGPPDRTCPPPGLSLRSHGGIQAALSPSPPSFLEPLPSRVRTASAGRRRAAMRRRRGRAVGGGGGGGEVVLSWGSLRRGAWGARPLASSRSPSLFLFLFFCVPFALSVVFSFFLWWFFLLSLLYSF
jgi:hypothetical protein